MLSVIMTNYHYHNKVGMCHLLAFLFLSQIHYEQDTHTTFVICYVEFIACFEQFSMRLIDFN